MFVSPLRSTTESALSSLVYFSRPPNEDDASFGVVVSKATKANGVEELEKKSYVARRRGLTSCEKKWRSNTSAM